jgi:hypothetical protein
MDLHSEAPVVQLPETEPLNATPKKAQDTPSTQLKDTPRKAKLKKTVVKLRTRLWRSKIKSLKSVNRSTKSDLKNVNNLVDKYLPTQTANFVKAQIKLKTKVSKKGYRWSMQDKMFLLSVFYHSRKVYRLLCKLFVLPSKTTLLKMLQQMNLYPGFNGQVFDALQRKVKILKPIDQQCVLIFDEMAIKTHLSYNRNGDYIEGFEDFGSIGQTQYVANHALAFMVRGLASKWKQCIGYFLSSGPIKGSTLQALVKEAITKLSDIGLSVKVVICDQGSNNRNFMETLEGVTAEKPYFIHNNQKVFAMYDPPHLLKNIRNNLKRHGFSWKENDVKWQYVVDFYEYDKSNKIRLAPKLTDAHIDLPPFTPMRVNLAAQVLSHTVAAGVFTLCQLGKLPKEAGTTADFLEQMDQLFNALNSKSIHSKQKFGHALSTSSGHLEFLQTALCFLDDLKLSTQTTIYCMRGWKITINALLGLWGELSENHEFKFLLTNRLNQDCAENLFSIIRGKGGKRDNPDAREFRAAYRQVVFDQMLQQSHGSNCNEDMDQILLSLMNLNNSTVPRTPPPSSPSPSSPQTSDPSNNMEPIGPVQSPSTVPSTNNNDMSMHSMGTDQTQDPPVDETLAGLEFLLLMKPPTSLPEQNVEAYMAGYLLRKAKMKDCDICRNQLIYSTPPQTELYSFFTKKAYKLENTLVYPTESFVEFIENLEVIFVRVFDAVKYMSGVLVRLCKNVEHTGKDFLECDSSACNAKLYAMMKLYLKVRLFHALKTSNRSNKSKKGVKRNRKMLKLQHI